MNGTDGPELTVVTEEDGRAAAIRDRRVRLGIRSQVAAEAESKRLGRPISRDAISAAEKGEASDSTYERLEALYDAFEEEIGTDDDAPAGDNQAVTVQISGNFGVSATIQGPVGNEAEIQALATALIREMRAEGTTE